MKIQKEKELLLEPNLEELSTLRKEIRAFLGEEGRSILRNRIVFCLDELVSNIIEHSGLKPTYSKIELRLLSYPTFWKFILIDEGPPFDPNLVQGKDWLDLYQSGAEGGFGLRAVKKLAYLHYTRNVNSSKNQITLHFRKGKHE